jgi:signal transduction histidine kinase
LGPSTLTRPRRISSRAVLFAGFGGLLLLMAFAGFDGIRALRQIQTANDEISGDFLKRTQVLERVRANIYLSGTYVRDFLLEPDQQKDAEFRRAVVDSREAMDADMRQYQALLREEESAPFEALRGELKEYWMLISRALEWSPAQRRDAGYTFLRDEVFSRRTSILALTDRIAMVTTARLSAEKLRVDAAYRQYRGRLAITIGLTIGLGLLLAAFTIRQIFSLEGEMAARYDEISNAREALQELSARLLAAQEDERRAIARELHDEVGQSLTGVLVELANLSMLLRAQKTEALEPKATEIKKLVEDSIVVVRNMALLLRPPMLDDLGLLPALQWQAREITRRSGVRVKIAAEGLPESLPDNLKTCIYRIVQEALHNVTRHAEAQNSRVSVQLEHGHIYLSIQDDGKGFSSKGERGMGLLGIEERVNRLGGSFAVESEPGAGAILRVILPVAA